MSTHTAIHYHIIFSTKNREPVLTRSRREDLCRYIWASSTTGAVIFTVLTERRTTCISLPACTPRCAWRICEEHQDRLRALWIKANSAFKNFSHWQDGYAAFACSIRDLDGLIEYIKAQEEHHRRTTFAEEYRKLLVEAGIEFDEQYMF